MTEKDRIAAFAAAHAEEAKELLRQLGKIPAPSGAEEQRADFIENWLKKAGAEELSRDEAGNVLFPLGEKGKTLVCAAAHMDVVAPDREALPMREENGRLICPGIGDDTANLVALLMAWLYFQKNKHLLNKRILFAADVCEEGLGNLAGMRRIMEETEGKISRFLSYDLPRDEVYGSCVGSERYRIRIKTRGGHSYHNFGRPGAIILMADLIGQLSRIPNPTSKKTTWNIGRIEGGTSVNVIPPGCEILYEFRSEAAECLAFMRRSMTDILENMKKAGTDVSCEVIGIRPCSGPVPEAVQREMSDRAAEILNAYHEESVPILSASTDANIPLSLGIPSVTFGTYVGGGPHTREEWVELDSMEDAIVIAIEGIEECLLKD